ncbi:MAG: ComEA family DNA-binding protein [Desulforhabdus sp.]|jgi:competence protein ComEA|nr:ComEA family DNA-binding protein [Desulforhabdus sp.]
MKKSIFFSILLVVALSLAGTNPVFGTSPTEVGKEVATQAAEQSTKVNINTADQSQLESLPGIGPAIAQGIVEHRETQGAFKSVEELKQVKGIGDMKYEAIKDLVTVE